MAGHAKEVAEFHQLEAEAAKVSHDEVVRLRDEVRRAGPEGKAVTGETAIVRSPHAQVFEGAASLGGLEVLAATLAYSTAQVLADVQAQTWRGLAH